MLKCDIGVKRKANVGKSVSLLWRNDKLKENNCHPASDIVLAFTHNMHNHTDFLELGEQLFHYNLEVIHKLGRREKKTEMFY